MFGLPRVALFIAKDALHPTVSARRWEPQREVAMALKIQKEMELAGTFWGNFKKCQVWVAKILNFYVNQRILYNMRINVENTTFESFH